MLRKAFKSEWMKTMAHWILFIFKYAFGYFGVFTPAVSACHDIVSGLKGTTYQAEGMFNFALSVTDERFLSLTMSTSLLRHKSGGFDFGSTQLRTLAHALSPCYVRLGGTLADFMTFDPENQNGLGNNGPEEAESTAFWDDSLEFDHFSKLDNFGKEYHNFTFSGAMWKTFTSFVQKVGWDLMFDFNLFKWHKGYWDPSNAELLLNYSDAMGYDIPAFQLGNEPNSFHHNFNFSIEPPILVKDFEILRKLISKFARYQKSQLFGPDVTNLNRHPSSRAYLRGFLQAGGNNVVSEISLHQLAEWGEWDRYPPDDAIYGLVEELPRGTNLPRNQWVALNHAKAKVGKPASGLIFYYLNGRTAKVKDFLNVTVLDSLKTEIETGLNIISESQPPPLSIRFTETSSCFGGGAPGLSDAYVAGFLWLDKLGLSAKYGVKKVFRQTFFGSRYALVANNSVPNPDFYLSLLHKRLILGPMFNVTFHPDNKLLRLYAHCTRTDFYDFAKGSITVAYLNVDTQDHILSLQQFGGQPYFLYALTPGDGHGLKSRFVKLNGRLLEFVDEHLPALIPHVVQGNITLPALTFGFVVVPKANVSICKEYSTLKR